MHALNVVFQHQWRAFFVEDVGLVLVGVLWMGLGEDVVRGEEGGEVERETLVEESVVVEFGMFSKLNIY